MTNTKQLGAGFIAFLIALPLVSYGFTMDISLIWGAGLLLLVAGAIVPVYARLHKGDSCCETSERRVWQRFLHL